MSPTIFRCLIVCFVLLNVAGASMDLLFPSVKSQSLSSALASEPTHSLIVNYPVFSLAVLLSWIVAFLTSTVGLLFFKRWARSMALYSTLFSPTIFFFAGYMFGSGLAVAVSYAGHLAWGAVLALAYYSPLNDHFSIK